jgi:hypothetical protein
VVKVTFPYSLAVFEGEGNRVEIRIVRELLDDPDGVVEFEAVIEVRTPFVTGVASAFLELEDVASWQGVLDALDVGSDAVWLAQNGRVPTVGCEVLSPKSRLRVRISDEIASLTTVETIVTLVDSWFDDAYGRFDNLMRHYRI